MNDLLEQHDQHRVALEEGLQAQGRRDKAVLDIWQQVLARCGEHLLVGWFGYLDLQSSKVRIVRDFRILRHDTIVSFNGNEAQEVAIPRKCVECTLASKWHLNTSNICMLHIALDLTEKETRFSVPRLRVPCMCMSTIQCTSRSAKWHRFLAGKHGMLCSTWHCFKA